MNMDKMSSRLIILTQRNPLPNYYIFMIFILHYDICCMGSYKHS